MTIYAKSIPRGSLAFVLLAGSLVLAGCDFAAAGSTAVLNADSDIPPTVRYEFQYDPSDVTGEGRVAVESEGTDDLGEVLSDNGGFSRGDVVAARIDSVVIERLSAPTFGYLTGADVHLGTSGSGPQIASGEFSTSQESARLSVTSPTVTGIVQRGATSAFARLDVDDPENVIADRVAVVVYYRLEVEGV